MMPGARFLNCGAVVVCIIIVTLVYSTAAQLSIEVGSGEDLEAVQFAAVAAASEMLNLVMDKPVVVTIGDSITAFGSSKDGWVLKLAADYGATVDIMNKGVPMGTTRSGVELAQLLTQRVFPNEDARRITLVTLCYGTNDASTSSATPDWRLIPLQEYSSNLFTAIKILREARVRNIILVTPPPPTQQRTDRRLELTAEYAAVVSYLGEKLNIPVFDLFSTIMSVPDWETTVMHADGLHLNARGNELFYQGLMQVIDEKMPKVSPEALWARVSAMMATEGPTSLAMPYVSGI